MSEENKYIYEVTEGIIYRIEGNRSNAVMIPDKEVLAELNALLARAEKAEALVAQSKACIRHILMRIREVPELYWHMGAMTGAWQYLTESFAALYERPVEEVVKNFKPEREAYQEWLDRREENERLIEVGREYEEGAAS